MAIASSTSEPKETRPFIKGDTLFQGIVVACAVFIILLLVAVIIVLIYKSQDNISESGLSFFTNYTWNPVAFKAGEETRINGQIVTLTRDVPGIFGSLFFVYGTVYTSLLALLIATPLAVGSAIFVSEYCPRRIGNAISFVIELLVAIPSIAYGVFAFTVLSTFTDGLNILNASIILAIMILPTILSISREIIRQVPQLQKEGMLALGATKWEAIRYAVIPYARSGIVGGAMLGLARAIGETMAVLMAIGDGTPRLPDFNVFKAGATLSSKIASQFGEAQSERVFGSAIVQLGLVLLIVSAVINIFSRILVAQTAGNKR